MARAGMIRPSARRWPFSLAPKRTMTPRPPAPRAEEEHEFHAQPMPDYGALSGLGINANVARRAPTLAEPPLDIEPGPWRMLERAWRDGVLQASCDRVSELYAREGRTDAWRLFMRHIIDGVAYPALEAELAIPAASAPMITRTALRRLRAEINAILAEEFTDPTQRARELDAILFDDGDADA